MRVGDLVVKEVLEDEFEKGQEARRDEAESPASWVVAPNAVIGDGQQEHSTTAVSRDWNDVDRSPLMEYVLRIVSALDGADQLGRATNPEPVVYVHGHDGIVNTQERRESGRQRETDGRLDVCDLAGFSWIGEMGPDVFREVS